MSHSCSSLMLRAAVVAGVVSAVVAGVARADMYLDLVAVPGAGYTVLAGGKVVQLDQPDVASIGFQFNVVFPGYVPGDETGLSFLNGVFLSRQTGGGAVAQGSLAYSNTAPFTAIPASNGRQQDLNADGLGDVGIVGSGEYGGVWVRSDDPRRTADLVRPQQTPFGPMPAPGDQVVGNLVLTVSSLHAAPIATSRTEYGYISRSGSGNHHWIERGVWTNAIPTVTAAVSILPCMPTGVWSANGTARWDDAANWAGGAVPVDMPVTIAPAAGADNTIDLNGDRSATMVTLANSANLIFSSGTLRASGIRKIASSGDVVFSNSAAVRIAGGAAVENNASGGLLTFGGDVSLEGANVEFAGTQPIAVAGSLNDNGYGMTVSGTLLASGAIDAAGIGGPGTVAVQTAGRLTAGHVRLGTLSVASGGLATIRATGAPNSPDATSRLASLSIAGGAAPTCTLDLNNNSLIIDYADSVGTVLSDVTAQIHSGRNGVDDNDLANWNGPGIITTKGREENVAIGVDRYNLGAVNNADFNLAHVTKSYTSFGGSEVAPNTVLVKYTYSGDADLSGVVDGDDYTHWLNGFLGTTDSAVQGWLRGDFNYDGVINGNDYTQWLNSFLAAGPPLGGGSPSPVPEPSTAMLLGMAAASLLAYAWRRRAYIAKPSDGF